MRTILPLHRPILLLFLTLAAPHLLLGQDPSNETSPWLFKFLPGTPVPVRLTANPQEPRTGIRKEIGSSHLKLDIGASFDLLELIPGSDTTSMLRFGADFFTYALSTSADGLRLQIDAVDGFFGGHLMFFSSQDSAAHTALRLRVLHQSAHFLDGHMNIRTGTWRDNRPPNPYTRDFGELSGIRRVRSGRLDMQLFAGLSFATLVRPTAIQRWTFFGGGEFGNEVDLLWNRPARLYAAAYFLLSGVPTYVVTTTLEGGVRLGRWDGSGVRLYLEYHSGLEVYGQYYDLKTERWGLGVAFDPW
jgi:hypothetical protein